MATKAADHPTGRRVQAWLPYPLDEELRQYAKAERRSLSSTVRIAVEDKLREAEGRRA